MTARLWALALVALIAALALVGVTLGAVRLTPAGLLHHPEIVQLRLPRVALALAVGANFALAGLIVQTVLRNPLAEPGTLGISAGASLAVVTAILLTGVQSGLAVPLIALAGGAVTGAAVMRLCGGDSRRLVLGGVIIGMALNALVMAVIVGFGAGRAELALLWMTGALYGRGFDALWPVLGMGVLAAGLLPLFVRPLALMRFGDDQAQAAGLAVRLWRSAALALAVALAASAVSAAGPVGFVGLVVPHLARLLVGSRIGPLMAITALAGAALTLLADTLGRTLAPPLEIPVGAVTGLIGVPVFLFLLQRQRPAWH